MFAWKHNYNTGIRKIDEHHQKLFKLINDLNDLANDDPAVNSGETIKVVFAELEQYAGYHFNYEEELMAEYGFDPAEFAAHKRAHESFAAKVAEMQKELLHEHYDEALTEAVDFTAEWIIDHILYSDKKYAKFFVAKGVTF
jgi:hemerythrin